MVDSSNLRLALLSAAVLGFRHGLDYDHIAAITDISSVQAKARDAMRFGLLYVGGHATTVAVLGALAVMFRVSLPPAFVSCVLAAGQLALGRATGRTHFARAWTVRAGDIFSTLDPQAWTAHANYSAGEWAAVDLLAIKPDLWGYPSRGSPDLQGWLRHQFNFSGGSDSWAGSGDPDATDALFGGGESWWDGRWIAWAADVYCGAAGDEYFDVCVGGGFVQFDVGWTKNV
jgi:hypothetical protein